MDPGSEAGIPNSLVNRGSVYSSFMSAWLYILASKKNGTLYTGVTTNLVRRMEQHQTEISKNFTSEHNVHRLVYIEEFSALSDAQENEHRIKRWRRQWKIDLIERNNPSWNDLTNKLQN